MKSGVGLNHSFLNLIPDEIGKVASDGRTRLMTPGVMACVVTGDTCSGELWVVLLAPCAIISPGNKSPPR